MSVQPEVPLVNNDTIVQEDGAATAAAAAPDQPEVPLVVEGTTVEEDTAASPAAASGQPEVPPEAQPEVPVIVDESVVQKDAPAAASGQPEVPPEAQPEVPLVVDETVVQKDAAAASPNTLPENNSAAPAPAPDSNIAEAKVDNDNAPEQNASDDEKNKQKKEIIMSLQKDADNLIKQSTDIQSRITAMLENLTATAPPNEPQPTQPDQTAFTGGRHKLKRKNTLHKRYNSKTSLKRRHKTNKNK